MEHRIGDIDLFLRILDMRTITAAARSLDLSVAVASQRLQRLERELGVRLLHRTTRSLHPTPEGMLLAERGRALVEEMEALGADLHDAGSAVAGTLRVTMSAAFGQQHVSPLIPAFLTAYPRVRLSVHLSDTVVDLIGEGFDLAIRIGPLSDSRLVARRIAPNRRIACAAPAYLAGNGVPRTPRDLADHECLTMVGSGGREDVWRFRDARGRDAAVRVKGRLESNTGDLLRHAVLGAQGVGLFSVWHVADDLRAGRLQQVLADYPLPETAINAVMPQRRSVPPRVRAFADYLDAAFGKHPPWEPVAPASQAKRRRAS